MIYSTRLIGKAHQFCMNKALLAFFLALTLFPFGLGFSQVTDTLPTLAIKLTSQAPYLFKGDDGKTVIIGEVENTRNFPVKDVKILVDFYDEFSTQPLESVLGTTTLDVIPPLGKSPYMIKSSTTNAGIVDAQARIVGFLSAAPKTASLLVKTDSVNVDDRLIYKATITNNGQSPATNIKLHLALYDPFQPPRILMIKSQSMSNLQPGATNQFEFSQELDYRASGLKLIAESDQYYSNIIDEKLPQHELLTKLVTINDIAVTDSEGNRFSDIPLGSTAHIKSRIWIQYAEDPQSIEQPYVYWIQVKQSGERPMVEFIGKTEGKFGTGGTQIPVVQWTPENSGLYFVETFVWEPNGAALASKGPVSLILVN